jgi:hypothetical protein
MNARLITQTQAFRRGVWLNVAASAAGVALFFVSGWLAVTLVFVAMSAFHLAGYWYGWARAMHVGGHREMFAAGDGVLIQIVGPQLSEPQKTQIMEALAHLGTVERNDDPEES